MAFAMRERYAAMLPSPQTSIVNATAECGIGATVITSDKECQTDAHTEIPIQPDNIAQAHPTPSREHRQLSAGTSTTGIGTTTKLFFFITCAAVVIVVVNKLNQ